MQANVAVRAAPYANTAIPLYLNSTTGLRWRTLNCLECGQAFLDRNGDTVYRLNDPDMPSEIRITDASIKARCGNCEQWYGLQIAPVVDTIKDSVPLYLQPQSIYITSHETKRLRYVHCLECGKAFHSISDRISKIVDNRIPFEYLAPNKIGVMEALCRFNNCGQTWSLML